MSPSHIHTPFIIKINHCTFTWVSWLNNHSCFWDSCFSTYLKKIWMTFFLEGLSLGVKHQNNPNRNEKCTYFLLPLEWRQGPDSLQVFATKLCNVLQSFLLLTAQHAEWLRVKVLQQGQLWRDKKHVIVHNRQDLSNYLEGASVPERPWWSSSPRSRGRGRCWSTPALLYRWA